MIVSTAVLAALCCAAFAAGTIDAIAGGGGLIALPALLTANLAPGIALATNKGQSTFGTASALYNFWRAGALDTRRAPVSFVAGLTGSALGAVVLLRLSPRALEPVVLALLAAVAVILTLRRDLGVRAKDPPPAVTNPLARAAVIALVLGFYDGFFGPGTGTFLIMAAIAWLGDPMSRATANAKVVNLASNLAALSVFAWSGRVRWEIALPMAVAQVAGGALGARLAVRNGDRFVRVVVLLVVLSLVARLASRLFA